MDRNDLSTEKPFKTHDRLEKKWFAELEVSMCNDYCSNRCVNRPTLVKHENGGGKQSIEGTDQFGNFREVVEMECGQLGPSWKFGLIETESIVCQGEWVHIRPGLVLRLDDVLGVKLTKAFEGTYHI